MNKKEIKHDLVSINKGIINSEELIKKLNLLSIHRIDNNVTGTVIASKSVEQQIKYKQLIKNRKVEKIYIGEIFGKLEKECIKITSKIDFNKKKDKIIH